MMIELDTSHYQDGARLKVIGVGGGGGNAINNMISRGLAGVDFIAANTDKQALDHNLAPYKIQIGPGITRGLGAGANPEIGGKAVEENIDEVKEILKGSDMIFVTAGMGGGTGTGGAPIIAQIAQEIGTLVVGIVTKPFQWEGRKRMRVAEEGISRLRDTVDALIVIPNQRLLEIIDKNTGFQEAFQKVDEVLYNATRGISDIIGCHGVINVDFADVKTIMKGMGDALMGIGVASGEDRAKAATQSALKSPLLDGISIKGSKGVLVNITGGSDLTMLEISEAVSIVEQEAGEEVNLIHGVVQNQEPSDEIMITVVATGFENKNGYYKREQRPSTEMFPANNETVKPRVTVGNPVRQAQPQPRNINVETPRGLKELKRFDTPAYVRRNAGESNENDKERSKYEKFGSSQNTTRVAASSSVSEQPAFIRKMLD